MLIRESAEQRPDLIQTKGEIHQFTFRWLVSKEKDSLEGLLTCNRREEDGKEAKEDISARHTDDDPIARRNSSRGHKLEGWRNCV